MGVTTIGYKVCLFPNKTQEKLLFKYSNTYRGIYNTLLAESKKEYDEEGVKATFNNLYSEYKILKSSEEYSWFNEIPMSCNCHVCNDLFTAYKRAFQNGFGFPKFKKKGKSKLSFYQATNLVRFKYNKTRIAGIGYIKCQKGDYPTEGYCNPRVTYDGKHWYLSFSIQGFFEDLYDSYNDGIGIDVGIKEFATVSNGIIFANYNNTEELIRLDTKLKKLQAIVSKKYQVNKKGEKYVKTKNIIKLEREIRLLQRRIHNIKLNYVHSYSSDLVKTKPRFIAIEDLSIKSMKEDVKEETKNLSKSIQKLMWYEFFRQIEYKSAYKGIKVVKVNRYYPSTQTCSGCGNKKQISLNERVYKCERCGLVIDRDLNASINIREEGRRLLSVS